MIEKFIERALSRLKKKREYRLVPYPPKPCLKFLKTLLVGILILIEFVVLSKIINQIHGNIMIELIKLITFLLYPYCAYKTIKLCRNLTTKMNVGQNESLEKRIQFMIKALKLYDEELKEIEETDPNNGRIKVKKEKILVRVIQIYYKETDNRVFIKILKNGDRFTQLSSTLSENLASALGLELDSTNSNVNYFEYVFLKFKDRRIDLSSSINNQKKNSDVIQITGNISYKLSKTPHSLIVGGTGSGKSFFILGKIVSYLSLTPQTELYIIDPKKADLSLLRFIDGLQDRVAIEPNQIAKMLREVVEIMEDRYISYFNDISAFGKDYIDFGLPPIIIIFDEFSAFLHSVDKKLSKEVLDYIFTIVMKGRQAGVQVEILMQRPSADDLPTNIRAQMGFKAGLGAMDKIGYNMIFDTNDIDYKTVTEKGGGYIQIDGLHTAPVYFETPYIDKNFDFIGDIQKLINERRK